ncbi:MAG: TonB-dependent receptor [Gammaproteobacteria bacterium]|nr:TonB-dependent receptor [Gammaproteobacteria bacterium]
MKKQNWLARPMAVAIATCSMVPFAWGQTSEEGGQRASRLALDEIVVTGTKRDQAAQDVPISITAISEEQLQRTFRNDILGVAELSPGVSMGQLPGFRAIGGGIRGTGQNSILVTQDSSVVVLVDEFGLSNVQAQFVELFDVEQIEIYRGPQGTLFGKSATGGAIVIRTKRPEMNERYAEVETQIGRFDGSQKGDIFKVRGAINLPLIEDQLSLRVTGIYDYDEGFYRNDKDTATFPNVVPFYGFFDPSLAVNPPLPPELDTQARGSGERLNGTDIFAGTVKLLWQPSDNYEAFFKYEMLRDSSGTVPGVHETPAGEGFLLPLLGFPGIQEAGHSDVYSTGVTNQCVAGNRDGLCLTSGQRIEVNGFHLHQRLDLDQFTVRLLTGYREQKEVLPNTYVGEAFTSLFDSNRNTVKDSLQVEMRLNSNFDGPFNFVGGVSYTEEETNMLAYATVGLTGLITLLPSQDPGNADPLIAGGILDTRGFLNLDLDPINDPGTTNTRQDRETWAIYFDGSYELTDDLTLSAGIRYTHDDKTFFRRANPGGPCTDRTPAKDARIIDGVCLDARSNAVSRATGGVTMADVQPFRLPDGLAWGIDNEFNDSWKELTWRLVMDYRFNPDTMGYLSYSTGFISGGFTETCSSLATCEPFDAETNWNLEAGLKAQFLENTLQTNASIFYTRYKDLIRSQVLPFTNAFGVTTQETINVNAGESEAYGIELEAIWVPVSNVAFDFSVSWLDHSYREFDIVLVAGQPAVDLSDLDVPFSPEWKVVGGVTFDQYLPQGRGSLIWNTSVNYTSSTESSVFEPSLSKMESRTLWDANVTWRDESEKYRVTLWAKNLLDETHRIGANSVAGLWNFTAYGRPRSFGMEVGMRF